MSTDFTYHAHDVAHDVAGELEIIGRHVKPAEVRGILCIGVCCGYEAGLLAKHYPDAEVHAIEAIQETYDNFLDGNRPCCDARVKTFCKVLDETERETVMQMSSYNTCHSLLELNSCCVGERKVMTTTAAKHCDETGLVPNFLMLDVEGVPLRVLRGLGHYLDKVHVVMAETEPDGNWVFRGGDCDRDVNDFLEQRGFLRVSLALPPGLSPGEEPSQFNSVWIRVPR